MKILHMLNIADFFFMTAGLSAAVMMMIAGDGSGGGKVKPAPRGRRRVR